jgi:hypothetical protein
MRNLRLLFSLAVGVLVLTGAPIARVPTMPLVG